MRNFVITGASGLVGGVLTANLLSQGHRVFCLTRGEDYQERTVKNVSGALSKDGLSMEDFKDALVIKQVDWSSPGECLSFILDLSDGSLGGFFHCAADFANSFKSFETSYKQNVLSNLAFLSVLASNRQKLSRDFSYTFVSTLYSSGFTTSPIEEGLMDIKDPISSYHLSKNLAEKELSLLAQRFDIPVVVVRPCGIMGDSKTGWVGDLKIGFGYVLSMFAEAKRLGLEKVRLNYQMNRAFPNLVPVDVLVSWMLAIGERRARLADAAADAISAGSIFAAKEAASALEGLGFDVVNMTSIEKTYTYLDVFRAMGEAYGVGVELGEATNEFEERTNKSLFLVSHYFDYQWEPKRDKVGKLMGISGRDPFDIKDVAGRMGRWHAACAK